MMALPSNRLDLAIMLVKVRRERRDRRLYRQAMNLSRAIAFRIAKDRMT
jgi:hypothetical protein